MNDSIEQWRRIVADNVKRLRAERRLSQEELSKLIGIDRTHLARFESQAINVSLNVLIALAAGLEVTPDSLLRPPQSPPKLRTKTDLTSTH
jgi:XRE family transcriptional regulator, regulator of sulfur utilization